LAQVLRLRSNYLSLLSLAVLFAPMQRIFLVLALLVAPLAASSLSAQAARSWLKNHGSPTDDQLGELKNANPDAYAMVKALLTKRSLGLVKLAPSERGPDVFRRMMTPAHLSAAPEPTVALPYASEDVPAAQPVNNMAYNPNAASDRDEASVDKLLAAVAGLAGKKGKKIALLRKRHHKSEDPFAEDAAMFGVETNPTPAPVQAVAAPEVEKQAAPARHKVNPYLEGLDLTGDMPEVVGAKHHHHAALEQHSNYLASFSFDDSAPAAEAPKPKVVAPKKKDNAFLKWLGVVKKAPAPQAQPKKATNSYLVDW